jgi:Na+-transporting methylmalonyl-CoA/oxaloacetate decarboxylase gamma subunit
LYQLHLLKTLVVLLLLLLTVFCLQELSQLKTRSALELQAREAEVQALKQQLQAHQQDRWGCAVAVSLLLRKLAAYSVFEVQESACWCMART